MLKRERETEHLTVGLLMGKAIQSVLKSSLWPHTAKPSTGHGKDSMEITHCVSNYLSIEVSIKWG